MRSLSQRILMVAGILLLAAGAGLLAAGSPAVAKGSPDHSHGLAILGFQSDSDPTRLIDRNAGAMTLVGVDGINLVGPGLVSSPAPDDNAQLERAHGAGLPAVLLVGNWSARIDDFSEPLAHRTLGTPSAVQSLAAAGGR